MRYAKPFVTVVVILLLIACGSVPPLDSELDTSASHVQGWTAPGTSIVFLPPVGPAVDTSGFYAGATITIQVWALDGRQGVRELHSVPVRVEDEFYLGLLRVSDATRDRTVTRVQVRVFATDLLDGSPAAEFCAGQPNPDACMVGSFDAQVRNSGKNKAAPGVLDVTRVRTVPIKVFVPGLGGLRPTTLGELTRLVPDQFGNKVPFDDTTIRNCIVNEFTGQGLNALGTGLNALGTGLNALGTVGGLFLLELGSGGESEGMRLFEPNEAGWLASGLVDYGAFDSAILVVDDFGLDPATGRPIYALASGLTVPADDMEEEDLKALVPGNGFSHGALVLHQIVQMVEGAGYQRVAAPWGPEFQVFTRSYEEEGGEFDEGYGPYLVVAAVDTDGFETDTIPGRIQNALGALRFYSEDAEDALDVRRVAINMSFAIVPCEVLEDATMSQLASFGEYLAALGEDNAVADDFYAELTELLLTPLGGTSDPLYGQVASCDASGVISSEWGGGEDYYGYGLPSWDQFAEDEEWSTLVLSEGVGYEWGCGGGYASIYVASSGNFGGSFPMYPAAWPLVVGVSSQDAIGAGPADGFAATKSPFANDGEVMAPGALFELGRSEDEKRALGYVGTSFSAPVVSLFTALDLMAYAPRCGLVGTSRLTDAEAGIGMDDPAANANLALDLAVVDRCLSGGYYFD